MDNKGLENNISPQFAGTPDENLETNNSRVKKIKDKAISFYENFKSRRDNQTESQDHGISSVSKMDNIKGIGSQIDKKKIGLLVLGLVVALLFVIVVANMLSGSNEQTASDKVQVKAAIAVQDIGGEFEFPLTNGDGEEVGKFRFVIDKAEINDEIIVKGQKATAVEGRVFLIVTLKVSNDFEQAIELNTRDYIRLAVNGNGEELLAPDIHNDPVEIQAISTKYTRVGFPINDTDSDLTLLVGEINGVKQSIVLDLF